MVLRTKIVTMLIALSSVVRQTSAQSLSCGDVATGRLDGSSPLLVASRTEVGSGSRGEVLALDLPENRPYDVVLTTCANFTDFNTVLWVYDSDPRQNFDAIRIGRDASSAYRCYGASELSLTLQGGTTGTFYVTVFDNFGTNSGNYQLEMICDGSRPVPTGNEGVVDASIAVAYIVLIVLASCCFCFCAGGGIYICLGGAICGIGMAASASSSKRRTYVAHHAPPPQVHVAATSQQNYAAQQPVVYAGQQPQQQNYAPPQGPQQNYAPPPQGQQQNYAPPQMQQYGQTPQYVQPPPY